MLIELVDELDVAIEEQMQEDLVKYEASCGIDVNYKSFSLLLREGDDIVGVLKAYTAFSEIYIDDIWVDSNHRRKGFGKHLIEELLNHFEGRGFNNVNLCTSAFQAPEFYKKCGFELEFVRENIQNPKLTKYFFVRFFKNQNQTQGTLQENK